MELHEACEVVREIHRATGALPDVLMSQGARPLYADFVSFSVLEPQPVMPFSLTSPEPRCVRMHRVDIPWRVCGGFGPYGRPGQPDSGIYEQHGQTRRWWRFGPTVVVEVEPAMTGILAWDVRDNDKGILVDGGRLMAFVFKRDDSHFEWQVRRNGVPWAQGSCTSEAEATVQADRLLRELLRRGP